MSNSIEIFSVRNVAIRLNISNRAVQNICKKLNIPKLSNKYIITEEAFKLIEIERNKVYEIQDIAIRLNNTLNQKAPKEIIEEDNSEEEDIIMQPYTLDEYNEIQKRLLEYNQFAEKITDLKNEINYLRRSLDKQSDQMSKMLQTFDDTIKSIRERNALEYQNTKNNI